MVSPAGAGSGAGHPEGSGVRASLNLLKGRTVTLEDVVVAGGAGASATERIQTFATQVLAHEADTLPEDLYALSKIHQHPSLPPELKSRIFNSALKLVLGRIEDPHLGEAKLAELVANIPDPATQEHVLDIINERLPSGLAAEDAEAIIQLFTGLTDDEAEIKRFTPYAKEMPIATIRAVLPLLADTPTVQERILMLETLDYFPAAEQNAIITAALPLIAGLSDVSDRADILSIVGTFPVAEREAIITAARPLMVDMPKASGRISILKAVRDLPVAEREAIITAARPLMAGITFGGNKASMLRTVKNLPASARALLTERISSLIVERTSEGEAIIHQRRLIIELLGITAPTRWTDTHIHTIIALVTHTITGNSITTVSNTTATHRACQMIAPDDIPAAVTILHNALEAHDFPVPDDILTYIFTADESLVARSHTYLIDKLSTTTNREEAHRLAQNIVNMAGQLRLSEIDPLFQQALQVLSITDPDARRNPKNPYRIYASLKALEGSVSAVAAPPQSLEGQTVRVGVAAMRSETEKVSTAATFASLPGDITPETVRNLFAAMRARLAALPADKQAAARADIASMCPSDATVDILDALERNLTEDEYLTRLLRITGAPTDRVPNDVWEFYHIIQFIQQQGDAVAEGENLSPREQVLIKMSQSIQFCSSGKKEGIGLAYGLIRDVIRTPSSLETEALKTLLYQEIVMPHLQHLLSDDGPFLREMTGVPVGTPISQLSHQAIYVKNLIAKRLGLPWDLTFDQHTGVLYNALVEKTVDQVLEALFRHFSPENLRAVLQENVKKRFKSLERPETHAQALPFYNAIMACLEFKDSCVSYTEDDDFNLIDCQLTPAGATELLMKLDFLEAAA